MGRADVPCCPTWVAEIDLDPTSTAPSMGTRRLADRPWLLAPDDLGLEHDLLDHRRALVAERRREVVDVAAVPETVGVTIARRVLDRAPTGPDHPLVEAGTGVVEDLCVLRRDTVGWVLAGAVLCFPSSWHLGEKVGRPLLDVHDPVPDYDTVLHERVESLLDRLDDRVVWRRNWFLHADDEWFQPERPDPHHVVSAERLAEDLWLRSERQTLSSVPSDDGVDWALFTIRIQHVPLGPVLESRGGELGRFLAGTTPDRWRRHGIGPAQAAVVAEVVGAGLPSGSGSDHPDEA